MAIRDLRAQRLFIDAPLTAKAAVALTSDQAHYLRNVLRAGAGDRLLIFNGRDGEWSAEVAELGKRGGHLTVSEPAKPQPRANTVRYLFAPLKRARIDYMVQKATELGVSELHPVRTRRTVGDRINADRLEANIIEAAEQCGVLAVPRLHPLVSLEAALDAWPSQEPLVFCDEATAVANPLEALASAPPGPVGVLVGPEGGFDADEREMLLAKPYVVPVSLGPRVMRADTAAIAVLALVNATVGDWV
ncbi:MAG: 16S rRNA (uracil(1498)-N(3))-methyltransferase [Pseudomonadota bacterium]